MITNWFDVQDDRFAALLLPNVHLDTLFDGGRWLEGPVYVPASRHLLFSDIPNNRVLRWDEMTGHVGPFQQPSHFANGHSLDPEGRVLACEHQTRRVTRVEHDGRVTVIADSYRGKRLNSPNDIVVAQDGAIWFTDPTYGIATEYEGGRCESEIGSRNVYRVGADGTIAAVITDLVQPNGLAFSPDGQTLYVADSGASPSRMMAYPMGPDGLPGPGRVLHLARAGVYDGLRLDRLGNLWVAAQDGVECLASDGTLLGRILTPEVVGNLTFGGPDRNRLFLCVTRRLMAVYLNVTGAA
jgi:gluconolactonase